MPAGEKGGTGFYSKVFLPPASSGDISGSEEGSDSNPNTRRGYTGRYSIMREGRGESCAEGRGLHPPPPAHPPHSRPRGPLSGAQSDFQGDPLFREPGSFVGSWGVAFHFDPRCGPNVERADQWVACGGTLRCKTGSPCVLVGKKKHIPPNTDSGVRGPWHPTDAGEIGKMGLGGGDLAFQESGSSNMRLRHFEERIRIRTLWALNDARRSGRKMRGGMGGNVKKGGNPPLAHVPLWEKARGQGVVRRTRSRKTVGGGGAESVEGAGVFC